MITRAQAEALLTLAESLEACERVGVTIADEDVPQYIFYGVGKCENVGQLTSVSVRFAVNALMPKHTGS